MTPAEINSDKKIRGAAYIGIGPTALQVNQQLPKVKDYNDSHFFTGRMSEINRIPRLTNAEIIASANVTDPERFRYEVESKIIRKGKVYSPTWPNDQTAFVFYSKWIDYFNSIGKHIATFKLKAWK